MQLNKCYQLINTKKLYSYSLTIFIISISYFCCWKKKKIIELSNTFVSLMIDAACLSLTRVHLLCFWYCHHSMSFLSSTTLFALPCLRLEMAPRRHSLVKGASNNPGKRITSTEKGTNKMASS